MTAPKVFISYSHDNSEHEDRVLELSDRLREDGIDANIDQYQTNPPEGWQLWMEYLTILINHYGLNMADPRAQEFINDQLEEFFFGEDAQMPDEWVAQNQGGAGPQSKGGGSYGKGAPAAPRK